MAISENCIVSHRFLEGTTLSTKDSSKCNARVPTHGGHGSFLASLSALSLVSITSHHHLHRSHNTMTLHKSRIISRQIPAPPLQHVANPSHGTRVTVRDLFGNLPVRVKQRAMVAEKQRGHVKDWEDLKRDVVSLVLSWPNAVSLTLRESSSNQKMVIRSPSIAPGTENFSVSSVCSILTQGSFISHDEKQSWVPVEASTSKIKISGLFSLLPFPTKQVQFVSLGIQPLMTDEGQSLFQDEINRLFSNSAFGVIEEARELDNIERERRERDQRYRGGGFTNRELKGAKKGVDRWPMFCINLQLYEFVSSQPLLEDVLNEKGQSLSVIMELLQVMVMEFLTKHHFRPKTALGRRPNKQAKAAIPIASASAKDIGYCSQPGREKSLRKTRYKPNALGTNVRMPSFRHEPPASRSLFDHWSIIKKGAQLSRSTISKESAKAPQASLTLRPSTAPPLTAAPSMKSTSASNTGSSKIPLSPLFAKDGKIARAPFGDVVAVRSQSVLTSPSPSLSIDPVLPVQPDDMDIVPSADDEIAIYMNPATGVRSLVNQRTGLIKKSKDSVPHQSLSRFSTLQPKSTPSSAQGPSPWVREILHNWHNPIFQPTETSIPQVVFEGPDATAQNILHGRHPLCTHIEIDRAFKEAASGIGGKISRDALKQAEIVSQVDMKFILVKLKSSQSSVGNILVLIDQHAADERIRVETLMQELCAPPSTDAGVPTGSNILTICLDQPIIFEFPSREIELLRIHQSHFSTWGIIYSLAPPDLNSAIQRLTVCSLPPGISERCKLNPRLLVDLIRTELYKIHDSKKSQAVSPASEDWFQRIHNCPQGILDLLNSRACRSAIMFNDVLSREQCELLVRRLAECRFPFQCAHGRPSLVPLVGISTSKLGGNMVGEDAKTSGFGIQFKRWKEAAT